MTIHHDKLAYGKLAPTSEELSEERLKKMLAQLNGGTENCEDTAGDETEASAETSENGAYSAPKSNKKHKK